MTKVIGLALLGMIATAAPVGAADLPAFVGATMCDAAAPISAGSWQLHRRIKAERRAAPARSRAPATQPAPQAAEVELDPPVVLRPALHFCLSPVGARNRVRWT